MRGSRRVAARISYREASSDGEEAGPASDTPDTTPPPQRRSKRPLPAATAPSSQDTARATRASQRLVSYKEDSSDGEFGEQGSDDVEADRAPSPKRLRLSMRLTARAAATAGQSRRKQAMKAQSARSPVKRARSGSALPQAAPAPKVDSDGIVPPWSTLPYEILRQIFAYASYPLRSENYLPTRSVGWLLDTARVCRAFTEPALTSLYRNPPLLSLDKPHRLLELVKQDPDSQMINYCVKVQRLELDLRTSLAYTATGWGLFDLGEIIPHLPQLKEIFIFNVLDQPGFRRTENAIRWKYPENLFFSLQACERRLKSWHWNANMCGKEHTFDWMASTHATLPFASLEHVGFSNFEYTEIRKDGDPEEGMEQKLARAIASLPKLKELVFEQSDIVNEFLLPFLPSNLTSLIIINCGDVTSEALREFLLSHGSQLKELILNHNQGLDLSFLPVLKESCPRLEIFKMDLNYYNSHITHHDSDPRYEILLGEEQIPTWPPSLQVLEMIHLRQWTSTAAENFFGSLIDSAEELPHLQNLVLKAILNIAWRDRAGFRDQWIHRFQNVFLRKSAPPNKDLMSLKAFRLSKGETSVPVNTDTTVAKAIETIDLDQTSDSDAPLLSNQKPARSDPSWGARRLRPRKASRSDLKEDSESETHEESDNGAQNSSTEKFIQGMCEVVDIRIDNQRPTESQFKENDFLDSEVSGDEDWNGDDGGDGGDRYAW